MEQVKLDYLGNQLSIGDKVIYINPQYKELNTGIILKLNDKQATIRDTSYISTDWKYDKMGYGKTTRFYNCIVRQIKEEVK